MNTGDAAALHEPNITNRAVAWGQQSRRRLALAAVPLLLGAKPVGLWDGWAAFADDGRCHAIARPVGDDGARKRVGSLIVGFFGTTAGQVSVRTSKPAAPGRSIWIEVAGRRFELAPRRDGGVARDARMDRAILDAMRSARVASVQATARTGGRIVDAYPLAGAATAIDAAALACR